jgi:hypothetical protein
MGRAWILLTLPGGDWESFADFKGIWFDEVAELPELTAGEKECHFPATDTTIRVRENE